MARLHYVRSFTSHSSLFCSSPTPDVSPRCSKCSDGPEGDIIGEDEQRRRTSHCEGLRILQGLCAAFGGCACVE